MAPERLYAMFDPNTARLHIAVSQNPRAHAEASNGEILPEAEVQNLV